MIQLVTEFQIIYEIKKWVVQLVPGVEVLVYEMIQLVKGVQNEFEVLHMVRFQA